MRGPSRRLSYIARLIETERSAATGQLSGHWGVSGLLGGRFFFTAVKEAYVNTNFAVSEGVRRPLERRGWPKVAAASSASAAPVQ
jgi:hypothetical protein